MVRYNVEKKDLYEKDIESQDIKIRRDNFREKNLVGGNVKSLNIIVGRYNLRKRHLGTKSAECRDIYCRNNQYESRNNFSVFICLYQAINVNSWDKLYGEKTLYGKCIGKHLVINIRVICKWYLTILP